MDALGLPLSFGKQTAAEESTSSTHTPAQSKLQQRGESSGRGSRGVVGGGKRKRARGAPAIHQDAGWPSREPQPMSIDGQSQPFQQNLQPHPSLPPAPAFGYSAQRGGHHPGGYNRQDAGGQQPQGEKSHDRGGGEGGFFRESFCEDPWKSLMEKRERRLAESADPAL